MHKRNYSNKFSKEVKYSLLCLFFTKKKKTRDNENIQFSTPLHKRKKKRSFNNTADTELY